MAIDSKTALYRVWAADKVVYGPVTLTMIHQWIVEERVLPDTWILLEDNNIWMKASEAPELMKAFGQNTIPIPSPTTSIRGIPGLPAGFPVGSLRRMKLLAGFNPLQLESFIRYLEVLTIKQFSTVTRVGDKGDAMFLILEGELRARILVDGKETTLTTMGPGDFFGEISLLDHGPRSADVQANQESLLLKISSDAFARMQQEAPALALPFLAALSQSIVGRVRTLTKKYQDSIHFSRVGTGC